MIPLRGFVEGDTMGLLVFAHQDMLLSEVTRRLLTSASVRVDISPAASTRPPVAAGPHGDAHVGDSSSGWELHWNGAVLAATDTVSGVGLTALDRVDLRRVTAR